MKLIKRLVFAVLVILVLVISGTLLMLNSVKVDITVEDLPENVYGSPDDLSARIQAKMLEIVLADESDTNEHLEDFMNLLIFKTIRDDVNTVYDPINGEISESEYIIKHEQFTLDYIYATLLENDQMMLTVSLKRPSFPKAKTALYFYFDMEMKYETMTMKLTLDKVKIDTRLIKRNIYDYLVSYMDKDAVEGFVDKGTLDLDKYTYEISFLDFVVG